MANTQPIFEKTFRMLNSFHIERNQKLFTSSLERNDQKSVIHNYQLT